MLLLVQSAVSVENEERKDVTIPANFSLAEEEGEGPKTAQTCFKKESKQSLQTR